MVKGMFGPDFFHFQFVYNTNSAGPDQLSRSVIVIQVYSVQKYSNRMESRHDF